MTLAYPADPAAQSAFWDDFQDELKASIDAAAPLILIQTGEPTQVEWEAAWVGEGNSLPITAGKRLLWYSGSQLRGEYAVLEGDYYQMFAPGNKEGPYYSLFYRANGDLLALVRTPPDYYKVPIDLVSASAPNALPRTWDDRTGKYFGIVKLKSDGSVDTQITEFLTTRFWRSNQGDTPFQAYYKSSSDKVYVSAPAYTDATSIGNNHIGVRFQAASAGGFVEMNAANSSPVMVATKNFEFVCYLGNPSSIGITVNVRCVGHTSGTVLFDQAVVMAANAPMTKVLVTGAVPGGWTLGDKARLRLTFSVQYTGSNYVSFAAPRMLADTSVAGHPGTVGYYDNLGLSMIPGGGFDTYTNMTTPASGAAWDANTFGYLNILVRDLTAATETQHVIGHHLFGTHLGNNLTRGVWGMRVIGVDDTGKIYITGAHGNGVATWDFTKIRQIWQYNPSNDVLTAIYDSGTGTKYVDAFYDETEEKIILNRGATLEGQIMNLDGTGLATMTGLYRPAYSYNGNVYGTGKGSEWPAQNVVKVWDISAAALIDYVPHMPNFEAFRSTVPSAGHAGMEYDTGMNNFVNRIAVLPLLDPLPVYLQKHPSQEVWLARYSRNRAFGPLFSNSAYALIHEGSGNTGVVRRILEWVSHTPDWLVLESRTIDIDENDVTFSLANYVDVDLSQYETLMLMIDSNCITANDTLTIQFNGDTGANYLTSYQYAAAAAITRAAVGSATRLELFAGANANWGGFTILLPGWRNALNKYGLAFGGANLGIATTNLREYAAFLQWANAVDMISTIKISTVTAGRKLRTGGTFRLIALKTKERFGDDVYHPALA